MKTSRAFDYCAGLYVLVLHNTLNFIVCCVNYFGHFNWLFTLHKQTFRFSEKLQCKLYLPTPSRALSEVEIDEINQLRPYTAIPLLPYINIVHPEESDDIYAEMNRAPTVSLDFQTQTKRRDSCPPELLTAPLLRADKRALRKHGLYMKKRKPSVSARTRAIQMRDRLDGKILQQGAKRKKAEIIDINLH